MACGGKGRTRRQLSHELYIPCSCGERSLVAPSAGTPKAGVSFTPNATGATNMWAETLRRELRMEFLNKFRGRSQVKCRARKSCVKGHGKTLHSKERAFDLRQVARPVFQNDGCRYHDASEHPSMGSVSARTKTYRQRHDATSLTSSLLSIFGGLSSPCKQQTSELNAIEYDQ